MSNEFANVAGRERRIMVAAMAVAVSLAFHVALVLCLSGVTFGTGDRRGEPARAPMFVRRLSGDPLAVGTERGGRAAPAPLNDRDERAQVDRLSVSEVTAQALFPGPDRVSVADAGEVRPSPERDWRPRQEIAAVDEPVVPDDRAAMPRKTLPKIERVKLADDVLPPAEMLAAGARASAGDLSHAAVPAAASVTPPHEVPSPDVGTGGLDTGERFGFDPFAARADRNVVPIIRPVSSNVLAGVDESVVAAERAAVENLRTSLAGSPFDRFAELELESWIDPQQSSLRYFRIRIGARTEPALPVIEKDVAFLVDTSGSIANDRLRSVRRALSGLLRTLNTGDRFNVVSFRDRVSYAFPAWRSADIGAMEDADRWLSRLTAYGQTDVFATLRSVLTLPRDPTRPIIALVVTDGDATSGMTRSAEIISAFNRLNGGLVSVYIYGVRADANGYLIDFLTYGNRGGSFVHTGGRWSAADGLPALCETFRNPVMSDISVTFAAAGGTETYPRMVANLYRGAPLEIYGVGPADRDEIVFSMRGLAAVKAYESVFRLPFSGARHGTEALRREWLKRRMYALVEAYSESPSAQKMRELQDFSKTSGIAIPYANELVKEQKK